jgi:excisionase family DNA binding protein
VSRLLTAREVADVLGVSTETVLRWTRAGKLPAIRLPGGALRFREDDLDAWLSRHLAQVPTPAHSRAAPARGASPTPQDAAQWQPTAPADTLGAVTHPEGEEH